MAAAAASGWPSTGLHGSNGSPSNARRGVAGELYLVVRQQVGVAPDGAGELHVRGQTQRRVRVARRRGHGAPRHAVTHRHLAQHGRQPSHRCIHGLHS
jgi:hypothetical protein